MDPTTPPQVVTLDQVVAYNLRRARQLRGWTQAQAAEQLEPYLGERWSPAVFSAAERSYEGTRVREFTASHVLAFSRGFDLPITWFYEPPGPEAQVTSRGSDHVISGEDLVKLLGGHGVEAWEAARKLVYDLLFDKARSEEPDYDAFSHALNRALPLGLITPGDMEAIVRLRRATAARREANYEAMKASWEGAKGEE